MTEAESRFRLELDNLRSEAEAWVQALFAYLAIHRIASRRRKTSSVLNKTPYFWNTVCHALQCTQFIVLGRVFDHSSDHNIFTLLRTAEGNLDIFSRDALTQRKLDGESKGKEWLPAYVARAYVPAAKDFRRLRQYLTKRSSKYHGPYRDIRRKVFAHKELTTRAELEKLFAQTRIGDIMDLFLFMGRLQDCLWELLWNGRKPILRQQAHSVRKLVAAKKPEWQTTRIQELIVKDTRELLNALETIEWPNHVSPPTSLPRRG